MKQLIFGSKESLCESPESPCFSILADECQDISTQEELSICGRWLVNGKPEEHFLTILHVRSTDASPIAEALQSSLQQKQLDLRKLIAQGYDGAATFAGKISGIHKRIQTASAHEIYIHCSCHRLQLASIHEDASVKEIRMFFGTMTNVWKLFYYSPQKAEALKGIQAVLGFPKLKIVKPSDTRWLSHECCVKAICKELSPLLQTLSQLYGSSRDGETYGVYSLLASVTSSYLLSEVLCPCSLKLVHAEEDS